MSRTAQLTTAYALGRFAFGVALIALPRRLGRGWLGDDAQRRATQVAIRGLGARDLALAVGTIVAVRRGGAVHGWLIACVACDLADIAATLAGGDELPRRSRIGTVAVAGGSAAAGTALTIAVGER